MSQKFLRTETPDDHFGLCSQCMDAGDYGAEQVMRNVGRDHFVCCDRHNVFWGAETWKVGFNSDHSADASKLQSMERVKPCYLFEIEALNLDRKRKNNKHVALLYDSLSGPQRGLVLRLLCELSGMKITADGSVVRRDPELPF